MKTEKGFRFTLQFPAAEPLQQQVGAFLERLGSKKSAFIVQALGDYLARNPHLLGSEPKIKIGIENLPREYVKDIIREVLAENGVQHAAENASNTPETDSDDTLLTAMLEHMDFFN